MTLHETRKNTLLHRQQEEQSITEFADELQSMCKTLKSVDGGMAPLQINNREKIVEMHKTATGESTTDTLTQDEIKLQMNGAMTRCLA